MSYYTGQILPQSTQVVNKNKGALVIPAGAAGSFSPIVYTTGLPQGATFQMAPIATGSTSAFIFPMHIVGWTGSNIQQVILLF